MKGRTDFTVKTAYGLPNIRQQFAFWISDWSTARYGIQLLFNNKMGSLELRSQQISEEINYYE